MNLIKNQKKLGILLVILLIAVIVTVSFVGCWGYSEPDGEYVLYEVIVWSAWGGYLYSWHWSDWNFEWYWGDSFLYFDTWGWDWGVQIDFDPWGFESGYHSELNGWWEFDMWWAWGDFYEIEIWSYWWTFGIEWDYEILWCSWTDEVIVTYFCWSGREYEMIFVPSWGW